MDERTLLLLGMLRIESQHGYQLNEFIEHNLGRITDMKKPTAYALLERLKDSGYVSGATEQEGNRPPRTVYAITPQGEQVFMELLRENLTQAPQFIMATDAGLMFLDALPMPEVVALLRQRLAALNEQIAYYAGAPSHTQGFGVDLAIEHHLRLLRTDADWLDEVIARLEVQAARP